MDNSSLNRSMWHILKEMRMGRQSFESLCEKPGISCGVVEHNSLGLGQSCQRALSLNFNDLQSPLAV